jgi:hypothetical protein
MSKLPTDPKINPEHPTLKRVRTLAYMLDNSIPIPGTSRRVGLDPLLGLIPGGGDVASAVVSAYIVLEAARFGLPRETLMRMLANLATDTVLGSVPVVGDFFDATWKSNSRNVALLEAHARSPHPQQAADRKFIAFLVVALILFVAATAAIAALVVGLVWKLING